MWSIAYKTLLADRGKFFTALVGVVFAFVLANVQGGLYLGLIKKAGLLVDQGDAQIWVGHQNMHNVDFARHIPIHWIDRVRSVPGVTRAEPYLVDFGIMSLPSGRFEEVVLVGVESESLLGNAWCMAEGEADAIRQTDGIIVDVDEDAKLGYPQIGELREIGGKRARIVAKSKGIVGFLAAPYVFTTIDRARAYSGKDPDFCNYYLVQTADGVDPKSVCRDIEQRVPELDAHVAADYSKISIDYWMTRTGIGISFGLATVLGLVIGVVMVGQTLYALVLDRIHEFATLKAIGAPESRVYRILLLQALIMAVAGTLVGMVLVALIQQFGASPKAPIVIPLWLTTGTTLLVVAICLLSAVLPYLRVRAVDPVTVLQT